MSLYLYVPTLPTFIYDRTLNLVVVGTILSMYGLWQAIIRIPIGVSVDASGRGALFILLGFIFSAAGALVMAFGNSTAALTIGRALTGLAAGTWVPLIAVYSGFFKPSQAVYAASMLTVASSVGRIIATSSTGFLNNVGGYRLAFFLAAGSAVAAGVLIAASRVERVKSRNLTFKSVTSLFRRTDVMIPSVISLVHQIGNWAVTFGFLPILAEELGANDVVKSLLMALSVAATTAGNLLNAFLSRKGKHLSVVTVSIALFCFGVATIAVAGNLGVLFVTLLFMGLANGFSYPTLMGLSIERVEQSTRTSAMGIHQSVYAIGMFVGPWLGGLIAEAAGIRVMFGITAAFILVVSLALIAVYAKIRRGETETR